MDNVQKIGAYFRDSTFLLNPHTLFIIILGDDFQT